MPTHYRGASDEREALDCLIKLRRATNTVGARLAGQLRDAGLTETQLGVLEVLFHLGPMPQTQLCGKLLTSGSNLTTVLDNLERHGLVRRERSTEDRRVQTVHLTDAGSELIGRLFPAHAARVGEVMGALTAAEQRELGRLCKKLGLGNAG